MYIAIAFLAAIFAAATPEKTKNVSPVTPQQQTALAAPAAPVLIDSRFFRNGEVAPWEKNDDPAEFLTSARTC